jgi:hypothetical protein
MLRVLGLGAPEQQFLSVEFSTGTVVEDPVRFWRLASDCQQYDVNEAGLRGWWPSGPKQTREYRILCVGDSCTFGHGVRYEDTYGLRLERLIDARHPAAGVRTMLAALPGYSTYQSCALLEQWNDRIQPDLTVIYCGGWNDYVPAVVASDDAVADMRRGDYLGGSRLLAVLRRLIPADEAIPKRDELEREFRAGRAPRGRRVPLSDYRRNLARLVDMASGSGGKVVIVVPPLPLRTIELFPVALEYRQATRDIAVDKNVLVHDAAADFAAFEVVCQPPWNTRPSGDPVCFVDWAHPSRFGHERLANSLFARLSAERIFPLESPVERNGVLQIESVEPRLLSWAGERLLKVRGRGLDSPGLASGLWVGSHRIRKVKIVSDREIALTLPDNLEPGEHLLIGDSFAGQAIAPMKFTMGAPELDVRIKRSNAGLEVDATLRGSPGWAAGIWLSAQLRGQAAATPGGDFWLLADPDGRPVGRDDLPFRFDLLNLPGFVGSLDSSGIWQVRKLLPAGSVAFPTQLHFQAGIADPRFDGVGALTRVVAVQLPE